MASAPVAPIILVHGGAGDVPESSRERHAQGCLDAACFAGRAMQEGADVVEAACVAVEQLENDPLYNAGHGCALTQAGRVSLDAAVMCGRTLHAAGLAALDAFPNPVRVAQRMLHEPEVLMVGQAASRWAEQHGFRRIPEHELTTDLVREKWHEVVENGGAANFAGGTVGAVVRDREGHLAAATSTGGTMGKSEGRVGDSPIVGAGTYADEVCAVSATGEGESFMRSAFSVRLADAVRYGVEPGIALQVMLERVRDVYGGAGGAIAVTRNSGPHAFWTTRGMSHGWWTPDDHGCGI